MKALNFYGDELPVGEIDIVINSPIPYENLKKRSAKGELNRESVPAVSIHDLIKIKVQAGRKQDLADVKHLKVTLEK